MKTTTSSDPSQALTTQATDWENGLVREVVIETFIFLIVIKV
jgi:hypothetical protein